MDSLKQSADRFFVPGMVVLCVLYLGIEWAYIARLPFVMDEFQGARTVYRLLSETPYVDFKPYKTVLGYYLQLPPMLLSDDPWRQMMLVKQAMALATAGSILVAAKMLRRHFAAFSILAATLMLVSMSTFLERSAAFRVDMLTSLFGLFALIFLLDRRIVVGGLLAGVSFLVSQKGIYFILCSGFGLGAYWLLQQRERRAFLECIRFSLAALAPIAVYFSFWAVLGSTETVVHEVLVKNQHIALQKMYEIRHFWWQTISRNPLFWILPLVGFGQIIFYRRHGEEAATESEGAGIARRDWILLTYGLALLGLCLWHKQPWPYFFVLIIPTFWILIAVFWEYADSHWRGISGYALAAVLLGGVLYPASRVPTVLARDNSLQHASVSVANQILEEGEAYLAGVSMLHTRPQAPGEFGWLDAHRLRRVAAKDPQVVIQTIIEDMPKLLITNYRIRKLPSPVLNFLAANYAPYTGNILLYAPTLPAGEAEGELRFSGPYIVNGIPGSRVEIDGREVESGETVWLDEGPHAFSATTAYRLHLAPSEVDRPTEPHLTTKGTLFGDVYAY